MYASLFGYPIFSDPYQNSIWIMSRSLPPGTPVQGSLCYVGVGTWPKSVAIKAAAFRGQHWLPFRRLKSVDHSGGTTR